MDTLTMLCSREYSIGVDKNVFPIFKIFYVNTNVAVIPLTSSEISFRNFLSSFCE